MSELINPDKEFVYENNYTFGQVLTFPCLRVMYPHKEIEKVNQKYRKNISEDMISLWRKTGMLNETAPGSWEETTLVSLLENQRLMQEC